MQSRGCTADTDGHNHHHRQVGKEHCDGLEGRAEIIPTFTPSGSVLGPVGVVLHNEWSFGRIRLRETAHLALCLATRTLGFSFLLKHSLLTCLDCWPLKVVPTPDLVTGAVTIYIWSGISALGDITKRSFEKKIPKQQILLTG